MSIVPLGIELQDATVLVVGGGSVGARKTRRFVRAGATVVVLSPEFAEAAVGDAADEAGEIAGTADAGDAEAGTVERVRVAPSDDVAEAAAWLDRVDPLLVVCATNDEGVNEAFAAAARDAGVLRNRADVAESEDAGSVVVPATVEDDPVVVSVSTGGRSPALSKYLREQLEDDLAGAGAMAVLTGEIRADLKNRGVAPEVRREAVRTVVRDRGVWKALRTGNTNARQAAETVVTSVVGEQGST